MWVYDGRRGQTSAQKAPPSRYRSYAALQNIATRAIISFPLPLVGAELPGDVKIKKSKLRGVASCGMNCSQRELGLGGDHDGIMSACPRMPRSGMPIRRLRRRLSDTVLDLEITPNRPDCLSMVGMAREVGAMYQKRRSQARLAEMAGKLELRDEAAALDSDSVPSPTRLAALATPLASSAACKVGPSAPTGWSSAWLPSVSVPSTTSLT